VKSKFLDKGKGLAKENTEHSKLAPPAVQWQAM